MPLPEPPVVARLLHVWGDVQGVGYRYACLRTAQVLGVAGWVENRADGSVTVLAVGPPSAVSELETWCRRGPRHATVQEVTSTAVPLPSPLPTGFEIGPGE